VKLNLKQIKRKRQNQIIFKNVRSQMGNNLCKRCHQEHKELIVNYVLLEEHLINYSKGLSIKLVKTKLDL